MLIRKKPLSQKSENEHMEKQKKKTAQHRETID